MAAPRCFAYSRELPFQTPQANAEATWTVHHLRAKLRHQCALLENQLLSPVNLLPRGTFTASRPSRCNSFKKITLTWFICSEVWDCCLLNAEVRPPVWPIFPNPMPTLDTIGTCAWQHGPSVTSPTTEPATSGAGFKHRPSTILVEHDTAARMASSRPLFLQASYLKGAASFKTSNYCLFEVSCPTDLVDVPKRMLAFSGDVFSALPVLLLALSGDVEPNPSPMSKAKADSFPIILETIRRLEAADVATTEKILKLEEGQAALVAELNYVKNDHAAASETVNRLQEANETLRADLKAAHDRQSAADGKVKLLSAKLSAVESRTSLECPGGPDPGSHSLCKFSEQIEKISSRCDENENRMRRSNLLFFGIEDNAREDWAASEQKIISFCSEKLGIAVTGAQFDRVHRMGKFADEKRRPISAKR
ncbi:uncharacterized protein [Dermacentor albipictus]|uniref:uncharacterized protein isoform X2 n=1 Tax=Dermacentor albipictus TaxID=60249 RepID=UPI0038FC19CD